MHPFSSPWPATLSASLQLANAISSMRLWTAILTPRCSHWSAVLEEMPHCSIGISPWRCICFQSTKEERHVCSIIRKKYIFVVSVEKKNTYFQSSQEEIRLQSPLEEIYVRTLRKAEIPVCIICRKKYLFVVSAEINSCSQSLLEEIYVGRKKQLFVMAAEEIPVCSLCCKKYLLVISTQTHV